LETGPDCLDGLLFRCYYQYGFHLTTSIQEI